jgi:Fe-S cluster assembly protein SufD
LPDGISIDQVTFNGETFEDGLDALNAVAAMSPQTFTLKKNTTLNFPITIVHNVTDSGVNKIISPRLNFVVEDSSETAIIEVFTSQQNNLFQYTTNAFTSFTLLKNAKIEHVKIVSEAKNSLHIGWTVANLARDSHFNSTVISMGQVAANNNLIINLNDVGAETSANAVFTLEKSETNNIFTTINHKHSHTHSTQLCKGILKDESFGNFNGNIVVAPDAQEITSGQLSKNLLLSKKAHIDTRPQLLVSADDVKCSHGATVGQLSDEETFYLESRGISKARAKEMLMHGFSKEIINLIKNKMIRDYCEKLITKK